MRRRLVALPAAALMAIVLTACGDTGVVTVVDTPTPTPPSAIEPPEANEPLEETPAEPELTNTELLTATVPAGVMAVVPLDYDRDANTIVVTITSGDELLLSPEEAAEQIDSLSTYFVSDTQQGGFVLDIRPDVQGEIRGRVQIADDETGVPTGEVVDFAITVGGQQ